MFTVIADEKRSHGANEVGKGDHPYAPVAAIRDYLIAHLTEDGRRVLDKELERAVGDSGVEGVFGVLDRWLRGLAIARDPVAEDAFRRHLKEPDPVPSDPSYTSVEDLLRAAQ